MVPAQQFRHVPMAASSRQVQRRLAIHAFLGVDIGPVGQQQFRHVLVTILRRTVQRRTAGPFFAEDQIRSVFEQRLDLRQVANSGRIMKVHPIPHAAGYVALAIRRAKFAVPSCIEQEMRRNTPALGAVYRLCSEASPRPLIFELGELPSF
jgi:hypothetical protein